MNKIYLAGTITGITEEEANGWRERMAYRLNDLGLNAFNPYTYMKKFYEYGKYGSNDIEKVAMDFDLSHVKSSRAVVVRLDDKSSLGTMAELATAYSNNIPIVALNDKDNKKPFFEQHPWVKNMISIQFFDEDELVDYICDFFKM